MADVKSLLVSACVAVVVAAATTLTILATRPAQMAASPASTKSRAAKKSADAPTQAALGVDVSGDARAATTYAFEIPENAVQADVSLSGADGDVEFRAAAGPDVPERDGDWTWRSREDDKTGKLSLTRHADDEFRPGAFFVEVRPTGGGGRRGEGRRSSFRLRVDVASLDATAETVGPGRGIDAETRPEKGHRRDFVVDVPNGTKALRIDLVDAERDLDVLASSQGPALDRDGAQWSAATAVARESLVVDEESDPTIPAGGKLWFSVVDPSVYDAPVKFRAVVTLGADPPAEALAIPAIPIPSDPRDRAVAAVVEILVDDGAGSGTIVSADGLVLTARHVIGERTGESGDITVALDLDPTRMTRDLFHAKVVKADAGLDLAVLRISSGLYGQALPKGLVFPACPPAFDPAPRLGDQVETIGFPEPAGTGTRAPVMYSRGVVSGFEREKSGLRVKTDAFIASGSSGGAVLDAKFRLVGVPLFVVSESEGSAQTGFFAPLAELSRGWREAMSR